MSNPISRLRSRATSKEPESTDLPPFLALLSFDCRITIYKFLVRHKLNLDCHNPTPLHLAGLVCSCTFLRDEIEYWFGLKSNHGWLTKVSSTKLGIFAPETTVFHFNFNHRFEWTRKSFHPRKRQVVDPTKLISQIKQSFGVENIRNLVVHNEALVSPIFGNLYQLAALVKGLKQLSSIEFIFHTQTLTRDQDVLWKDLWDMWKWFWGASPFCHPKQCCSCCALPEVKWAVYSKEGDFLDAAVAPFWDRMPRSDFQPRFTWAMYQENPHFDDYDVAFALPGWRLMY
jgi:hypothetical protein